MTTVLVVKRRGYSHSLSIGPVECCGKPVTKMTSRMHRCLTCGRILFIRPVRKKRKKKIRRRGVL